LKDACRQVSIAGQSAVFGKTVYRHVVVPAIRGGASVMDDVFGG